MEKEYNGFYLSPLTERIFAIGSMVALHITIFAVALFCVYYSFAVSYDPMCFIILAALLAGVLIMDVMFIMTHALDRYFVHCTVDAVGLHCSALGIWKWDMLWEDIRLIGTANVYTPNGHYIFFSCNPTAHYDFKRFFWISKERIVFSADRKYWEKVAKYAPEDIKETIENSLRDKKDCRHRRTGK